MKLQNDEELLHIYHLCFLAFLSKKISLFPLCSGYLSFLNISKSSRIIGICNRIWYSDVQYCLFDVADTRGLFGTTFMNQPTESLKRFIDVIGQILSSIINSNIHSITYGIIVHSD